MESKAVGIDLHRSWASVCCVKRAGDNYELENLVRIQEQEDNDLSLSQVAAVLKKAGLEGIPAYLTFSSPEHRVMSGRLNVPDEGEEKLAETVAREVNRKFGVDLKERDCRYVVFERKQEDQRLAVVAWWIPREETPGIVARLRQKGVSLAAAIPLSVSLINFYGAWTDVFGGMRVLVHSSADSMILVVPHPEFYFENHFAPGGMTDTYLIRGTGRVAHGGLVKGFRISGDEARCAEVKKHLTTHSFLLDAIPFPGVSIQRLSDEPECLKLYGLEAEHLDAHLPAIGAAMTALSSLSFRVTLFEEKPKPTAPEEEPRDEAGDQSGEDPAEAPDADKPDDAPPS